VHEVVELVDENEYVHESSDITEEALFVSSAEEAAEEAPLLWWFRRGFWFRGGLRFRYGLRLRFGFRLSLFLWLRFRLALRFGLGRGLRLWWLEGRQFARLGRAEDPAAPALAQLLEQTLRLLGVEIDVTRRVEQLDEPRGGARIASNLQLLGELERILSRQRDAAAFAGVEETF
jgi:hypothetical protein